MLYRITSKIAVTICSDDDVDLAMTKLFLEFTATFLMKAATIFLTLLLTS